MNGDLFETTMRRGEYFHGLTIPPGMWAVLRLDGRSFTKMTAAAGFEKPFDERFADLMTTTAEALIREFDGLYAYTESDEISVLLPPGFDLFDREVEKLVSVSAALAAATFTHAYGVIVQFDSRLWIGATPTDVVDYFSWRAFDAARNALNGWTYWTLRKDGMSARGATSKMNGLGVAEKNELLFEQGINFNETPAWGRRGVGLWWELYLKAGFDPIRQVETEAMRRRIHVDRALPAGDSYRALVAALTAGSAA